MGKKTQARPGLDGMAPGPSLRVEAAARRRAARVESKKQRKKLQPGGKHTKRTALEELQRERKAGMKKREKRIADLKAQGALYDPAADKDSEHAQPPFSYDISVRKNILYYEVTLHKVPIDKIRVEVTERNLKLDTLEHSKKFVLHVPHPEGVKVEPKTSGLAEISPAGVLGIKLKMTHVPAAVVKKHEEKQKSIEEVRHLRFRRNQAGEFVAGARKIKVTPQLGQKRSAQDEEGDAELPPKKKPKKKTFVTDKEVALQLIDSIAQEDAPKKQERKTVLDHVTDMKAERKERRIVKRAKKQTMETQAAKSIIKSKKAKAQRDMEKALKEVKPLKDPTGRRVKFAT
ncbi:hypothetical protein DIPPA_08087 [Diplonema papillatum]|nr:hypothetical protein DIPPA_08087 [Diplonema papillatum]